MITQEFPHGKHLNHGDTETKKYLKKLRISVSPWFKFLAPTFLI
jgi:hypothetical protein